MAQLLSRKKCYAVVFLFPLGAIQILAVFLGSAGCTYTAESVFSFSFLLKYLARMKLNATAPPAVNTYP